MLKGGLDAWEDAGYKVVKGPQHPAAAHRLESHPVATPKPTFPVRVMPGATGAASPAPMASPVASPGASPTVAPSPTPKTPPDKLAPMDERRGIDQPPG